MWLEAILSRDDLVPIIRRLAPVTILLGEPSSEEQSVHVTEVAGVSLVEGEGLRVTCRAWIEWPWLGVTGRISIDPLTLMLKPSISRTTEGYSVIFTPEVEHADVLRLPAAIDDVTQRINDALTERHVGLSWNFARELNDAMSGTSIFGPLDSLNAHVSGGRVWVTEDALVVAISFLPLQRSEAGPRFDKPRASFAGAARA